MKKRIVLGVTGIVLAFVLFQLLYGGRPQDAPVPAHFEIIAHRGAHTNWYKGTYDLATGCEAQHMREPTLDVIENTLDSIDLAFELGATIVEIDIQPTRDGHLVILHDWMLDCRTDGTGEVRDHTLAELQALDICYGYTHDGGQTYPFRGQGVGLMPTLIQVLDAFPEGRFLIDHKDSRQETAALLVEIIRARPPDQQARLFYWGPDHLYQYVHGEVPAVTRLIGNRPLVKTCLLPYLTTLGLAGFPGECRGEGMGIPIGYTWAVAGWPYRFLRRTSEAGMRFYALVDSTEDAQTLGDAPVDGVITDWIEVVGPIYSGQD